MPKKFGRKGQGKGVGRSSGGSGYRRGGAGAGGFTRFTAKPSAQFKRYVQQAVGKKRSPEEIQRYKETHRKLWNSVTGTAKYYPNQSAVALLSQANTPYSLWVAPTVEAATSKGLAFNPRGSLEGRPQPQAFASILGPP